MRALLWLEILDVADDGVLYEYLQTLDPRAWHQRGDSGATILHFSVQSDANLAATRALIRSGVDVEARGWSFQKTPLEVAVLNDAVESVRVLCAAGARIPPGTLECAALLKCGPVLIASGARGAPPELASVERGVLRCRAAVAALFVLKATHKQKEWYLTVDRNLIRLVALSLWSTRDDDEWTL